MGGTVLHVNSLRGACLVQGMTAALLLRRRAPELPISEAHPKALLWLLGLATKGRRPRAVSFDRLAPLLLRPERRQSDCEHERDAALGTLSAWAMVHRPSDWEDLSCLDEERITPLCPPPFYWMARAVNVGSPTPPAR